MKSEAGELPRLIEGGLAVDDRGQVSFVNDFGFSGVRRFYMVSNHSEGFVRAWHAHRREAKFVFVTSGAAIVGAVRIDDWDEPSKGAQVHRYVLSAEKPAILYIPAGYANGFKSLTAGAGIMFFSTASMDDAKTDDVRYDARYWDIWNVVER
jgi:dTDP-4-dehydrorhamnose 3,5-epimerase